ncbi:hypothetical protein PVK06_009492 [Gossypium arboreum]|uniref:DNA-directed RNA polymerase III subunit RPC6 n=1 Tax=Gossypium arboreum TaxID=29729 RepID=A0ABR0QNL1_GOSAR|nr:hypothetical protein PVK06_009492 [Gossypium arboreum]
MHHAISFSYRMRCYSHHSCEDCESEQQRYQRYSRIGTSSTFEEIVISKGPAVKRMNAKRKRPDTISDSVTEQERIVHEVIRSKQDMGISQQDMKREINLHSNLIAKCIKSLVSKNLIKEVKNIHSRRQKHYMSAEFEPSNEITGGAWYVEGSLDKEYINVLKEQCWRKIYGLKVATLEGIADAIKRSNVSQIELSKQQVEEIVKALVLDNEVMEVRSTGTGEFASIPVGKACYKCAGKRGYGGEPKLGALASIPCGVCPQISRCTPDGIISPITCEYYKKWLEF